ncbi:MAG: cell division protein ZapA [Lachnospiraceae bacterium]|nr:cell division protein ZapA [Lachnospiraceae bacterium]
MNQKNDIEVTINGKRYVLAGYESDEYLQRVATYINHKYEEFKGKEGYNVLDADMRNVLMQINITDDFFKAKQRVNELSEVITQKDRELFELRHEAIGFKTQIEGLVHKTEALQQENLEEQKKRIRLEAELESNKSRRRN